MKTRVRLLQKAFQQLFDAAVASHWLPNGYSESQQPIGELDMPRQLSEENVAAGRSIAHLASFPLHLS